jgi:hypothetical protein
MRPTPSLLGRALVGAAVLLAGAACADMATQPAESGPRVLHDVVADLAPSPTELDAPVHLLACPSADSAVARAVIGPEGGTVGARGTTITIPAGAVPDSTLFELVVPASPYMEADIHAVGVDHYVFQVPATITINYARCPAGAVPDDATLQGVYVDSRTYAVLQRMGGVADRSAHKVTFPTDHLSGYIVAY